MRPRSYLYVPADAEAKLAKAEERGADALILDLEDAVAPSAKQNARAVLGAWLQDRAGATTPSSPELWVRINHHPDLWRDDLEAVVGPSLTGIVVPKASRHRLDAVAATCRDLGAAATRLAALVETAAAISRLGELAHASGLSHLGVGEADLRAELGIEPSDDEGELLIVRSAVVVASAEAGLPAPVGPTSTDFRDLDALRASTQRLRRLGFRGRTAIHPAQLAVIHEVFTPTAEELAEARAIVDRYETALARGAGVATGADGRMLDEAVVRAARRTLEFARDEA